MKDVFINICIPYYNASEYFEETLISITNQSYKNWKIYIFDDGSDKTEIEKLYPLFRGIENKVEVIHSKHIGVYKSRLELINKVKNGYLIFVDADDMFASDEALSQICKQIEYSNADIIFYNYSIDRKDNLGQIKDFSKLKSVRSAIKEALRNECLNSLWNKAINVKVKKNIVFPELENIFIAEDRLISIFTLLKCKSVSYINKVLYLYRDNILSASNVMLDLDRLFCQLKVEKQIQTILKTAINYSYCPDVYLLESVFYTYLWFVFKNCKNKNTRIKIY